jgi:hypothetical protein
MSVTGAARWHAEAGRARDATLHVRTAKACQVSARNVFLAQLVGAVRREPHEGQRALLGQDTLENEHGSDEQILPGCGGREKRMASGYQQAAWFSTHPYGIPRTEQRHATPHAHNTSSAHVPFS